MDVCYKYVLILYMRSLYTYIHYIITHTYAYHHWDIILANIGTENRKKWNISDTSVSSPKPVRLPIHPSLICLSVYLSLSVAIDLSIRHRYLIINIRNDELHIPGSHMHAN